MRLAQLARKLDVRQGDIIAYLEGKNIDVQKGSNFRLDDAMVALILERFGPAPDAADDSASEAVTENISPSIDVAPPRDDTSEPVPKTAASADPDQAEDIELIRAPKVELPGLTVVGKIELPERKPKTEEADEAASPVKVEDERPPVPRKKRRPHPGIDTRNTAALRREREARAAERKRRAEEEQEKERRRQKYLSKVRINVPTKPARIYEEEVEELQQNEPEEPKRGLWGKFMGWLFRKA